MLASHEQVKNVQKRKQLLGTALPTYRFFMVLASVCVLAPSENMLKETETVILYMPDLKRRVKLLSVFFILF